MLKVLRQNVIRQKTILLYLLIIVLLLQLIGTLMFASVNLNILNKATSYNVSLNLAWS